MNTTTLHKSTRSRVALAAALLVFGLGAPGVQAQVVPIGTLTLSKVPLFLNQAVDPNLLVSFDDSGSMAFGYMPDIVDDNCGWRHPRYYWNGFNKVAYNPNINYVPPLQPNGDPFPNATFTSAWIDGFEAATGIVGGAGGSGTVNLSNRFFPTRTKNARDGFNQNTIVGHDYRARNTTNCNNDGGANNNNAALPFAPQNNNGDRGTNVNSPAFYYRFTGSDPNNNAQINDPNNYVAVNVATASAQQRQNFANWYSYYRNRYLFARTAASRSFAVLDSNIRVGWQNFNQNQLAAADEIRPLQGTWRTNFFNWLYRTNASGGTPLRASLIRAGEFFTRSGSNFRNPYWQPATTTSPARELTCRQNFHIALTDGFWNEGNPSHASNNSNGDDDTRSWALPDGRTYNPGTSHTRIYSIEPANIGNAPTMADIAFHYWRRDLRTDLDDKVPPFIPDLRTGVTGGATAPGANPLDVPEIYFNPANNPATWQHMVNFIVGLGVAGGLDYPGDFEALRTGVGNLQWPNTLNNHFTGVDDTWHAAINSRGEYFSAGDPQELVTALTRLFSSVQARSTSITPVSVSSALLTFGARAFRTGFDTSDWSGSVVGLDFIPDDPATPGDEESFTERWRAEDLLTARSPNSRTIWTAANANGTSMVNFDWGSLNNQQRDFLRFNVATQMLDSIATGQLRLNYIRGDRSEEVVNGGVFRNRKTLLGAVVNSGATVVSQPIGLYVDLPEDPSAAAAVASDTNAFSFEQGSAERGARYDTFRRNLRNRAERVYVGANDGMLHAFNGDSGEEVWGFVPYKVYPNLSRLTSSLDLDFQSYVDGTPEVRDAFIGGQWRTILVQTLRLGGQGVFAMDITDPDVPRLLWEYSDVSTGGADLGFTYGQPFITRMHNGRWAALVPGGYNSEVNDGSAGSRQASLYIIDLENGSLTRKFNLGSGTIGLSGVVGGDYSLRCDTTNPSFCKLQNANVRDVTDVAFAGDLTGNLWRFDLTSSSPNSWTVDRMFQARNASGIAQPISAQPWLAFTEDDRVVVLFGTGKYIEPSDRTLNIPQQTMYGIFDQGPGAADYPLVGQNRLLQQNLSAVGTDQRTLTVNQVDPSTHRGWFFDYLDLGERNIVRTGVRVGVGIGIAPTLIPTTDDPCDPNARSFLLFFDVSNGGIPGSGSGLADRDGDGNPDFVVSFDTNGDRQINASDDATIIGTAVDDFIAAVTPVTMPGGGEGRIILPGGPGAVESLVVPEFEWRRRSWRELFRE